MFERRLGLIWYFLNCLFHIYKQKVSKQTFEKSKMSHGGQKSTKKCHVIFEWPLSFENEAFKGGGGRTEKVKKSYVII